MCVCVCTIHNIVIMDFTDMFYRKLNKETELCVFILFVLTKHHRGAPVLPIRGRRICRRLQGQFPFGHDIIVVDRNILVNGQQKKMLRQSLLFAKAAKVSAISSFI